MVHVVKKNINGQSYLYLQENIYRDGRRTTKHVAYLGKEGKLSGAEIKAIINDKTRLR